MTANNTTPQCPDDPVLRDACVPDGRRLCAHADRDGAGMHWLEAGQTCRSGDDDDDDRGAAAGGAGNRAGSNRPGPLAPNRFGEPPTGFACARCGRQIVTSIAGVPARRAAGSPQRFCSPACREAARRRRRAEVPENAPLQPGGGGTRSLARGPAETAP